MSGARAVGGAEERLIEWFGEQGWTPFPFQKECWEAYASGGSGLVHAPTGLGKTYAVWGGALLRGLRREQEREGSGAAASGLFLWITPLRALAGDTAASLRRPLEALGLNWSVEVRTGDTSAAVKRRQRERLPTALVTTPESLSLLLSYPDWRRLFRGLEGMVVDEWHELLGTKRGVQTELGLARLRHLLGPKLRIWGLSATLGNLEEAKAVLLGGAKEDGLLIRGVAEKRIEIRTLIPDNLERFPWAGHLGIRLLPQVVDQIASARTTLVFTNTRSQTEIWYRSILDARPDWEGRIGVHHGSVERELRDAVERKLDNGGLQAVVCTSSLDLGVDFTPVDQVIQIGSPKGIARLMQRAGRSGHQPGAVSRIIGVPTNGFELVEFASAREAMLRGEIESRQPLESPLDVLLQHLATCALGGGFEPSGLLKELRDTHAYRDLGEAMWAWCLEFSTTGGKALGAYPQFSKLIPDEAGRIRLEDRRLSRQHRMSIGTITSDAEVQVVLQRGGRLGSVEESFVSRLKPGMQFSFAGRRLELVRFREMKATVRPARGRKGSVPSWQGGRSPLSTELSEAVCRALSRGMDPALEGEPELVAARPLLEIQSRWSRIPERGDFLVESTKTRSGQHVCFFPFAGRLVHEGLAALVAYRLTRRRALSVRVTPNDYGFSLISEDPIPLEREEIQALFAPEDLLPDLLDCLNATELARRQFREIARVAGLVQQGFPGERKTNRQVQVSSGLLFDVFARYDPENLLLEQARREVLEKQLEFRRLERAIHSIGERTLRVHPTERLTPLAFPLWADQIGESVSSETRVDRIEKMLARLEKAAGV